MRKFVLLILISAIVTNLSAQKLSLGGKITDEEKNPLAGATVLIKNSKIGVTTNLDGRFQFKLNPGQYVLEISYLGFETKEQRVSLNKDYALEIALSPVRYISEEVIIEASRAGENTPVAKTNISKEKIEEMQAAGDIPYQLSLTPSVVTSSETGTGSGYTAMRIRGSDMTRINVTVNGIPLNDSESQGVYWVNMPNFTSSVNSIQIQRGVGTSSNGAASFGASVNFQTTAAKVRPYGEISSSIGSFNHFSESISAGTGLIKNKFSFDFRYSKLNTETYIDRGFADHSSMFLSGAYYGKKDMLKANAIIGNQRTGITWWGVPDYMLDSIRTYNPAGKYKDDDGNEQFYDGQTDNYKQNHYQVHYIREISKKLNVNAALHATTGKGYYEQYIPQYDDWGSPNAFANYGLPNIILPDTILNSGGHQFVFPDSTISATDMIRQKWLDNIFYGATVSASYKSKSINASFGAAGNKYDGDHFGLVKWTKFNSAIPNDYEWYRNVGVKTEYNAFAKMQYTLSNNLSIFADMQVRNIEYSMEGPDDDLVDLDKNVNWTFLNPKAGLNYQMSQNLKIYGIVAVANREPARADIKEAIKEGGTQMPRAEQLMDIEFGGRFQTNNMAIDLNFYYMQYKDQLVQTGELNSVGYSIMTNVPNSYRRGIELVLGYKPIKVFEWNGNITLSQNRIKDYVEYATHYDDDWNEANIGTEMGETNISYSPEIIASNILTYKPYDNLGVSLITKYVGEQYIDNTSDEVRKLDDYLVNNMNISFTHKFKNEMQVQLQFLVNNILDAQYINNAYGGNWYEQGVEKSWIYYYPQAGRNYMFKTVLRF